VKPAASIAVIVLMLTLLLVSAPAALAATPATAEPAPATTKTTPAKDDGPNAAERRAADSAFEREKLDQGAFKKEEGSSGSKDGEEKSGGGSILRGILGLAVVLGAIYGLHWLLRKWGASRIEGVAGRSDVIDVVATTSLAQGRALHLVRVGGELVLVGATENSITRIGDFDPAVVAASAGDQGRGEFQAALSGAFYGQQPGVPSGMGGAGSGNQPFLRRFLDNLRMSTAR